MDYYWCSSIFIFALNFQKHGSLYVFLLLFFILSLKILNLPLVSSCFSFRVALRNLSARIAGLSSDRVRCCYSLLNWGRRTRLCTGTIHHQKPQLKLKIKIFTPHFTCKTQQAPSTTGKSSSLTFVLFCKQTSSLSTFQTCPQPPSEFPPVSQWKQAEFTSDSDWCKALKPNQKEDGISWFEFNNDDCEGGGAELRLLWLF